MILSRGFNKLAAVATFGLLGWTILPPLLAAPDPKTLPEKYLSAEERAAAHTDLTLSLPAPGEFFAALAKTGSPNWLLAGRATLDLGSTSRPQLALNLGAGVADGYLAVEQQNSQEVKNTGRDILSLARKLNVSEGVMARGRSINEFAENNEWMVLQEELEATQNEIQLALEEQMDSDLLTFIATGAWLRALQSVVLILGDSPDPAAAQLLRQSDIALYLLDRFAQLPQKTLEDPLVVSMRTGLGEIRPMLAIPSEGSFSPEQLSGIQERAAALLKGILSDSPPPNPPNDAPSPDSASGDSSATPTPVEP